MTAKKIYILPFLFLFFSLPVFSQKTETYLHQQLTNVSYFNRDGEFEKASRLIDSLYLYLKKENAPDSSFANLYFYKGSTEIYLGKYKEAIRTTQESLKLFTQENDSLRMATCLNQIGVCFYYLSDYDNTKIYYERSFLMKKKCGARSNELAVSAYNLAMAYEDLVETEKALELYKEAEKYLLNGEKHLSFLPDVYAGIANIYNVKKDIETAERYAEKAMDVGLRFYGEYNPNITFIYTLYSDILKCKKEYKEAIKLLQKTLKIREDTYGENHIWTCECNISLANAYILDKQFEKAEIYLENAIKIGKKTESGQYLAKAQTILAELYFDEKIHEEKVEGLLLDALKSRKKIFGEKNDLVAQTYYLLAKNNLENNETDLFRKNLEKTYLSANYDKYDIYKVVSPIEVIDALVLEGEWYQKKYQNDHNPESLKKKFNLIDAQIEMIRYAQRNFSSDYSKISFANDYRSVFEEGLNTCWQLYKETQEYQYLQKAFELSETNRNTTLLSGLQENKFKLYSNIPPELLLLEKDLEKKLSGVKMDLYYEKQNTDPDKDFLSELIEKRIKLNKNLDSLHMIFNSDYSRYKSLKYSNKNLKIEDVQKELDNQSQLIIYFLEEDDLYTFSITSDKVRFIKNDSTGFLIDEIDDFKKGLLSRKDITDGSKNLYNVLLKDQLDQNKNKVVIIPDNILSYIPFEILKDSENRYVLERYRISYSGSTRLLLELRDEFFNYKHKNPWIGFSPSYSDEDQLNATDEEVEKIGTIVDGKIFAGKEATKNNFLSHNKNYSIMHLAMHARIDHKNPMFSKLEFSDGDLTSSEIYFSDSKANLVVLSACNTGFGKLEKGEGVMSLARAFHFSGVPAVIMSLWKVPDKETRKIMVYFYEFLEKGISKSEALQKAKIKYLETTKDEALKHPYYWSGFVLNGNTVALYHSNKLLYLFILIGVFTSALIFLIYRKYYK